MAAKKVLNPEDKRTVRAMRKRYPKINWDNLLPREELLLAKSLKQMPETINFHLPRATIYPQEMSGVIKQSFKMLKEFGLIKRGQQEMFPMNVKDAVKLSHIMLLAREAAEHAGSKKSVPLNVKTFDKIKVQLRGEIIRHINADPALKKQFEASANHFFKSATIKNAFQKAFKAMKKKQAAQRKAKLKRKRASKRLLKNKKKAPDFKPKPEKKPPTRRHLK